MNDLEQTTYRRRSICDLLAVKLRVCGLGWSTVKWLPFSLVLRVAELPSKARTEEVAVRMKIVVWSALVHTRTMEHFNVLGRVVQHQPFTDLNLVGWRKCRERDDTALVYFQTMVHNPRALQRWIDVDQLEAELTQMGNYERFEFVTLCIGDYIQLLKLLVMETEMVVEEFFAKRLVWLRFPPPPFAEHTIAQKYLDVLASEVMWRVQENVQHANHGINYDVRYLLSPYRYTLTSDYTSI